MEKLEVFKFELKLTSKQARKMHSFVDVINILSSGYGRLAREASSTVRLLGSKNLPKRLYKNLILYSTVVIP